MAGVTIAFSGKGGSGKTTLAAMVLRELLRAGRTPVLAVDADPNATLALALGVCSGETIADLRDKMGQAAQQPGEIPKERLMDQWLIELLSEQKGYDLLTMGRPEGPKCYCYVNALLRRYLSLLRANYACTIVDCEAGMEYLSRLTVDEIDVLVLVAEDTPVGLTTAGRIAALAEALPVRVHRRIVAVNKVRQAETARVGSPLKSVIDNADAMVTVPYDADLAERSALGEAINDDAGPRARPTIEQLVKLCLNPTEQTAALVQKENA